MFTRNIHVASTQIIGTGGYAPEKIITNADLEKIVNTSDAWITERTGIKERRQAAEGELTSDLAVQAAIWGLGMANTRPDRDQVIGIRSGPPEHPMTEQTAVGY